MTVDGHKITIVSLFFPCSSLGHTNINFDMKNWRFSLISEKKKLSLVCIMVFIV